MLTDQFGNEVLTESVLILFLYQSTKAIKVILSDGRSKWIPKSIIRNLEYLDHTNFDEFQYLEIDKWFCDRYEIPPEY